MSQTAVRWVLRQLPECRDQAGFDVGQTDSARIGQQSLASLAGARLRDPVHEPDRVLHGVDPLPVLPGVGDRLGCSVSCVVYAEHRHQRSDEPRLSESHELFVALTVRSGHDPHTLPPKETAHPSQRATRNPLREGDELPTGALRSV